MTSEFARGYDAAMSNDWSGSDHWVGKSWAVFNRWEFSMLDPDARKGMGRETKRLDYDTGWVAGARARFEKFMEGNR